MRSLFVENDFDATYAELNRLREAEEVGEEALRKELGELEDEIKAAKAKSNAIYKAALSKASEIEDWKAASKAREEAHREYMNVMNPLWRRREELKDKIRLAKGDGPIDEEDIDRLTEDDRLIVELEYDNLDGVEVEGEFEGKPYDYNRDTGDVYYEPDYTCTGTLNGTIVIDLTELKDWDSFDRWSEILSKYLKKPVGQIMRSDLESLDFDDFNDFVKDWYEEYAQERLQDKADSGDYDDDDVNWHEDDYYDDYEYEPDYGD